MEVTVGLNVERPGSILKGIWVGENLTRASNYPFLAGRFTPWISLKLMASNNHSKVPRREFLSEKTANCIRECITQGEWTDELPSEAALCRQFQVSRVTVRRALSQLSNENWFLKTAQGSRRRINPSQVQLTSAGTGKIIRVLAPFSGRRMGAVYQTILDGLSQRISRRDFRVEFESRPQLFKNHRPKELNSLKSLADTAGWVLFFSTASMQRWFAEQKLPCVIAGRLHEEFPLSCVYPDSEAVARHAACLIRNRGHQRIGHLKARETSLSDHLAAVAFQEQANKLGMEVQSLEYSNHSDSICKAVTSLLAAASKPSVLYLTCPEDAVTALCHVLRAGIAVPDQLSILVGWDDPILESTVPNLARYEFNAMNMGRQIGGLLLKQLDSKLIKHRAVRILPELADGDSLGPGC